MNYRSIWLLISLLSNGLSCCDKLSSDTGEKEGNICLRRHLRTINSTIMIKTLGFYMKFVEDKLWSNLSFIKVFQIHHILKSNQIMGRVQDGSVGRP